MSERPQTDAPVYTCPMHPDVRELSPGKCPHCGTALVPEGTRFGLVRHIPGSPMHVLIIGARWSR
jgi:hypothetical protein